MSRFSVLAVAVSSCVALSTVASSASADSIAAGAPASSGCFVTILQDETSLPSNAPAIFLNDNSQGGTATVTAELVSGDTRIALGGPTKDTHGFSVLRFPAATPAVGKHTISTKVACSVGNGATDRTIETPLTLTPAVPFPKTVGTLSVLPSTSVDFRSNGQQQISLEASAELRAFFPVSMMRLNLAGDDAPVIVSGPTSGNGGSSQVVFTAPTGRACVENGALIRDKRTVKVSVSAEIAGLAESPAPASLDVVVDCGAIRWTSSEPGKPSGTTPSDDASATTGGGSAGGCTAAPVGVFSGSAAALVAGAVAVLAGLRRRRRDA